MLVNFGINLNQILTTSIGDNWDWITNIITSYILFSSIPQINSFFLNFWISTFFTETFIQFFQVHTEGSLHQSFLKNYCMQYGNAIFYPLLLQQGICLNLELMPQNFPVLENLLTIKHLTYNFVLLGVFLKYSLCGYICYYFVIYSYFNSNILNTTQNYLLSKFLHIVESEEELGSLDDSFTLIFLFLIVFGWFFCLSLAYSYFTSSQFTLLGIGVLMLISFILLTPLSTLLDFGISFAVYIRGASSSSNLLVECLFDIIGTLVVFTRFVVQNIRFVLIFFAYFELYEWTYGSYIIQSFLEVINFNTNNYWINLFNNCTLDNTYFFYVLSVILSAIITYLYYLVHLLILIFVQVTIYLLISFWLFFFFYTSFTLNKNEKLFMSKRINICLSPHL